MTVLVSSITIALTSAMVIQLAYDAKSNRPVQIGRYFRNALINLPALTVLSLVSGILIMIGFVLLIVPGVWLYGVFSVLVPAIVIDVEAGAEDLQDLPADEVRVEFEQAGAHGRKASRARGRGSSYCSCFLHRGSSRL